MEDSLTHAERIRLEALKQALQCSYEKTKYNPLNQLLQIAETLETWLYAANHREEK